MKRIPFVLFSLLLLLSNTLHLAAQTSGGTTSSSTTTTTSTHTGVDSNFMANNWPWMLGIGILLIVIIAVLASRNKQTTVEKTTVVYDEN